MARHLKGVFSRCSPLGLRKRGPWIPGMCGKRIVRALLPPRAWSSRNRVAWVPPTPSRKSQLRPPPTEPAPSHPGSAALLAQPCPASAGSPPHLSLPPPFVHHLGGFLKLPGGPVLASHPWGDLTAPLKASPPCTPIPVAFDTHYLVCPTTLGGISVRWRRRGQGAEGTSGRSRGESKARSGRQGLNPSH